MLKITSIKEANQLADTISYSSRSLNTIPGSPLNNLVKSLVSLNETGSDEELFSQGTVPGSSAGSHSEIEEDAVFNISKIMGNIINTAKNIVNPHCRAIIEEIEKQRAENVLLNAGLSGNIIQVDLPPVLKNELFRELIAPYRDTPASIIRDTEPLFKDILDDFTTEELRAIMMTGSASLDEAIKETLGDGPLPIYDAYSVVNIADLPMYDCIEFFLLLTGFQQLKTDKVAAIMSDTTMDLVVARLRAGCGGKLHREINLYESSLRAEEVVARSSLIRDPYDDSNLYVNGPAYRKWLAERKGSPEAALGYLAMNGNGFDLGKDITLRNNPDFFYSYYTNRLETAKAKAALEDILIVRRVTGSYMADIISKMEDANRPALQKRLAEALSHEYHGAASLTPYVIKVVCRSITEGEDVKDMLLEIDSILSNQTDKDLTYAVNIATIRLVARWLRSQMLVLVG